MMLKELIELNEALKDIKFDETIIIFGFEKGVYLEELETIICEKNNVYIIEPDEIEYENYKNKVNYKNINLISLYNKNVESIISDIINKKTFLNLSIQIYGQYDQIYEYEWNKLKSIIDKNFYKCSVDVATNDTFKLITLNNIISNLKQLNNSYKFDSYLNSNENVAALVVSAGPSFDKNLQTMIENKDKLDKFFIIAGNRTFKPLLKNGITPDLVVSIDPQDITYEMMEDNIDSDVPFLYCEKSNYKIVKEYKGIKVAISQGILNNIKSLEDMVICLSGGSIAHVCTDVAFLLGCNPIIFLGQDFGFTKGEDHSKIVRHKIDKAFDEKDCIIVKDVNGDDLYTSELLNLYKENLEKMIELYSLEKETIDFINASYGANIKKAKHEELKDVLNRDYKNKKIALKVNNSKFNINVDEEINSIKFYLEKSKTNILKSKSICEEIINNPTRENIINFGFVLKCIDDFMKDRKSVYIENYIATFLVYIKEKLFTMKASEYGVLSRDIIYQSNVFRAYMDELEVFVDEIYNLIKVY